MSDFLPKNYSVPSSPSSGGSYMKFQQGKNRFRVLSSAIFGEEYWKEEGGKRRPVRVRPGVAINPAELPFDPKTKKRTSPKHFWAFVVWNYSTQQVEILEITQKSIMFAIEELLDSEDWGSVKDYDLTVIRSGEGMDTEYSVVPSPKKPVDPGMTELYENMTINLEHLFDGTDPFTDVAAQVAEEVFMAEQEANAKDYD